MPTDHDETQQEGLALVARTQAVAVVDQPSFEQAGEMLLLVKRYQKRVHDVFDAVVEAAFRSHKVAVEQRKSLLHHAEAAERTLKDRMAAYEQAIERQRQEAEAAAQAERARLEADALRAAAAEEQRLRVEAETAQIEAAARAFEAGDGARAEKLLEAPVVVPRVAPLPVFTPPVAVARPQAAGVSFRDEWDFEIVNAEAIPRTYLAVDHAKIRAVVRAMKSATVIPGIRVVRKRVTAVRQA